MFHFSLQTVLEVRERFEKIKYKEYYAELLVKQGLEYEKAERLAALRRSAENIARSRGTLLTTLPLQLHDHYRRRLEDEIAAIDARLRDHDDSVEVKRRELVEARRSHRALEILRDKEYRRYLSEVARRERTVMDEIAANYHSFKQ